MATPDGGGTDLLIVGAGSAGFSAALAAVENGASVILVERGTIGGTCVNVGCVPSKILIRAAEAVHGGIAAQRFAGIGGHLELVDWAALREQKNALVAGLRKAKYEDLLRRYPRITHLRGRARLTTGGVRVGDATVRAERIVVTTGSRPVVPEIPGLDTVPWMDSAAALDQETLPASMIVLGAGYVGVELGQMFARFGVAVTLLCRRRLLPEAEPEISESLTRFLEEEGIRVLSGLHYRRVRRAGERIVLSVERDGTPLELSAERLLLATGRRPDTEDLGLEEAGVALTAQGAIAVDSRMRTTRAGVYAAGDVTGRHMFVYMAAHGGRIAALNALEGDRHHYDDRAVPSVVFSDPQVASVGLTEAAAAAAGIAVRTAVLPLDRVPRAQVARDTRGLVKLVAERGSGRLLGVHILAPEGADAIQTGVLALRHGLTVRELAATVFPHLTTVEGLRLAAQSFDRDPATLSCCAG